MQFKPPSQPGWGQPESDPMNSRVQQQPMYPPGQQQWQQPQQPFMQPQPQKPQKKKTGRFVGIGCSAVVVLVVLIAIIAANAGKGSGSPATNTNQSTPTSQATSQVTTQPTSVPTQPPHYPPTTQADLRGLATQGDASVIHPFHQESVGLTGVCAQPKVEATVDSNLTGKQLAENLLAYFYIQQLDNPCGSLLLVYHNQSEANDVYTAGRILFDATDSSGSENTDPNASNLKYTLTLDIGGVLTGEQEYVVTY